MKRLLICILFFLIFPAHAFAQNYDWTIDSFSSDVTIQKTGIVHVHEIINTTFNIDKHGIYRDIPYRYSDSNGGTTYTQITHISTGSDENSVSKQGDLVQIKIGDPNKTFTGPHTYTIDYDVVGVIRNFPPYDELYWNLTGNDWDVPINTATAVVHFPSGVIQRFTCYQGETGMTQNCISHQVDSHTVQFSSTHVLSAGEGLTGVVNFPQGIVPLIHVASFADQLKSPISFAVFFLTLFIGTGGILLYWWNKGRDKETKGGYLASANAPIENAPVFEHTPMVVEYEPPDGLRPAEIGVLVDEKADTLDVTATIIDLASRGYMTITEKSKKWLFGNTDYLFTRTDKKDDNLLSYEKLLLDRLFGKKKEVLVSSLKRSFYEDLKDVKAALYKNVVDKTLFPQNPESVRSTYTAIAIVVGIVGGSLLFFSISNQIALLTMFLVGLIISAINIAIFSRLMPRRTAKGHMLNQRVRGYREFIEHVEKYRQQFFEKKNMFNEVLPYAIVFGLTEKFAKALKDMGTEVPKPTWYYGAGPFNPILFSNNVSAFSDSLSSAMVSTPKGSGFSSGGGFSGGGFGGGGGGSW